MFANAKRGEVNYSNNPTFLEYGQDVLNKTSSVVYEENSSRLIKNTVSSSYTDYSASFKRQVYVGRVAIYDESKNLIGVATLSNPVLKEEDQDLTFKINILMFMFCSYCDIDQMLYCLYTATLHIVFFDNKFLKNG